VIIFWAQQERFRAVLCKILADKPGTAKNILETKDFPQRCKGVKKYRSLVFDIKRQKITL
jgi:hypothetical protein